jgi:hypothetical protein
MLYGFGHDSAYMGAPNECPSLQVTVLASKPKFPYYCYKTELHIVSDFFVQCHLGNHILLETSYERYKFIWPNSSTTTQLRTVYEGEDSSLL